jgi:GT2 family glycosyltransferase
MQESPPQNPKRRLYPQELLKISQAVPPINPAVSACELVEARVTIVVLSCERFHLTRRTTTSIYENTEYPFRLLIFDNGSSSSTVAALKELKTRYPTLEVCCNPTNLGASGGRNAAFSRVDTEYVISLDNDIICHPGWLSNLMKCAIQYDASFIEPMRLDHSGLVWSHGAELSYSNQGKDVELRRWFHDLPCTYVQSLFEGRELPSNYLSGGAGLFRLDEFFQCGGFDPVLDAFEDLEFCFRMHAQGFAVWTCASSTLTHDDKWLPDSPNDVRYAQDHYDIQKLQLSAKRIREKWGVNVFPPKYVEAYQRRLASKLKGTQDG